MRGLRRLIIRSLEDQGFSFANLDLCADVSDKDTVRQLHTVAVTHKRAISGKSLAKHESRLLERFANGNTLKPEGITPRLQIVLPGTDDEILFRYATLHWSIPVSSGYGRRLRYLVIDEQNDKLMGLIGLGDPVFSLSDRDKWIGWDYKTRRSKLRHVMDAFVLGAVAPYSQILGGKLIASLVTSNEIRQAFHAKYRGVATLIGGVPFDGRLALITTTSALGRSSIYNRLQANGRLLYHPVGWTRGSGEFHFANGLYQKMTEYAHEHFVPTAKHADWGTGFRNRREIVKRCLQALDLPANLLYHGIQRQVFVAPLAENSAEFLRGEHVRLRWFSSPYKELGEFCKQRWLLPRARWDMRYREFDPRSLRLWT